MSSSEIQLFRGDDANFTIQVNDANGNGIDITGATLFFTVKINPDDSDTSALISKSQSSHTDAQAGTTGLTFTSSDLSIKPGVYYYDFQLVSGAGIVTTYGVGKFTILQDITRRVT